MAMTAPTKPERRFRSPNYLANQSQDPARRERREEQGADPGEEEDLNQVAPPQSFVALIHIRDAIQRHRRRGLPPTP